MRSSESGGSSFSGFVDPGDLCFDIGAKSAIEQSCLREIGARIISVSLQGSCIEELQRKFGDDEAVVIVPSAVGAVARRGEIAVCEEDSTIATMSSRWQNEGRFSDRTWTGPNPCR